MNWREMLHLKELDHDLCNREEGNWKDGANFGGVCEFFRIKTNFSITYAAPGTSSEFILFH